MKLNELREFLQSRPKSRLNVVFPDGDLIEPEFHVTEVGYVVKNFIDCGGTRRKSETCVLQTWVSENDKTHRLCAGKLATILSSAADLIPSSEIPVELEYEGCNVVQYPLKEIEIVDDELRLVLGKKHTDCLAKDSCGCGEQERGCE